MLRRERALAAQRTLLLPCAARAVQVLCIIVVIPAYCCFEPAELPNKVVGQQSMCILQR